MNISLLPLFENYYLQCHPMKHVSLDFPLLSDPVLIVIINDTYLKFLVCLVFSSSPKPCSLDFFHLFPREVETCVVTFDGTKVRRNP